MSKSPMLPRVVPGGGELVRHLHCPSCGQRFATRTDATITARTRDTLMPNGALERDVRVGQKVLLDPGYVNARRRRWEDGPRWYRPGKRPSSPSPTVRLPAIVTCRCGQDLNLQSPDVNSVYSVGDRGMREIQLENDLADEGEDYVTEAWGEWAEETNDLARGKNGQSG